MAGADADDALTERTTARVWKSVLSDGGVVAVKRAVPDAPVTREAAVLRFLAARGCPVPSVIEADDTRLVTEWVGDLTLDDALQARTAVDGRALGGAVRAVSSALAEVATTREDAVAALKADLYMWGDALTGTLKWLGARAARQLLGPVIKLAAECSVAPGSLDYTARNVVLGVGGPILLDFAATGFDWDERRLAQYALSAGADRPDGVFRSALDAAAIEEAWNPEGIDAHEVLLLLIAAEHLRQIVVGESGAERSAAWSNIGARHDSLMTLLSRPLCSDGPAAALRAAASSMRGERGIGRSR